MKKLEHIFDQMQDLPTFLEVELTDPNIKGHMGDSPLHVAANWGDLEAIAVLHAHGADLDAQDEYGYTPLLEAAEQEQVQAVRLLLKLGARKDIRNSFGLTALETVEIDPNAELIELLQDSKNSP